MEPDAIIEPLRSVDWNDIDAVAAATRKALTVLAEDGTQVRRALLALPERPELLSLCERAENRDTVVLWNDRSGIRVQLHVFLAGYARRPHNHPWSYASRILTGQYRHCWHGNVAADESAGSAKLRPLMARQEESGGLYALHHSAVHAVAAEPYTISLVIRGPVARCRVLVTDRRSGESRWRYADKQAAAGRMPAGRVAELTDLLRELDLF
jgi:hypothetical protein